MCGRGRGRHAVGKPGESSNCWVWTRGPAVPAVASDSGERLEPEGMRVSRSMNVDDWEEMGSSDGVDKLPTSDSRVEERQ